MYMSQLGLVLNTAVNLEALIRLTFQQDLGLLRMAHKILSLRSLT